MWGSVVLAAPLNRRYRHGMTTPPPEPPSNDAASSASTPEGSASSAPPSPPPPTPEAPKKRRWKLKLTLLAILLVPLLFLVLYTVIMLNYAYSSGTKAGYLQRIEARGWFCKTDEGELLITSAPGVPAETWAFSVRDDSIAQQLLTRVGQRVVVRYEEHRGLPTRCFGATSFFVDSIL